MEGAEPTGDRATHDAPPAHGWTRGRIAAAAGLVAAAALVNLDAWADIAHIALHDEEASQVLLVPFVVAWIIWARKDELARARPEASLLGPAAIALGWAASWYGYHHSVQAMWHGGAVLVAAGAFVTVTGWAVARRIWPALLVLVFLVPVPGMIRQQIAIPMQSATATLTQFVFELLGVAVSRAGNVLYYNGTEVLVAEACNGMRMVFVLILVCYAVAFATPLRAYARALVMALSPLAAIACNVVRLVPTVWLYGQAPHAVAEAFHDYSGWAMIVLAFVLVMGAVRLLQWVELPVMQPEAGGRSACA